MTHHLTIEDDMRGPQLRLRCTATPDAPCRMRPAEDDRESWSLDDPDLTPGHDCWAVEWASDGGWETVGPAAGAKWPIIPVVIEYDEGVVIAPVLPGEPLPFREVGGPA